MVQLPKNWTQSNEKYFHLLLRTAAVNLRLKDKHLKLFKQKMKTIYFEQKKNEKQQQPEKNKKQTHINLCVTF